MANYSSFSYGSRCRGKQRHKTRGKAEAHARHEAQQGNYMMVYPCNFCKHWHVGHALNKEKQAELARGI